ncbi:cutinase-domain-containing protein [Apiospora sp. TS-2023a]
MHANTFFTLVSALALTVSAAPVTEAEVAAPVDKRAGACSSYTIINTRGTGEPQGQSLGFTAINRRLTAEVPGGKIYNTVYFADASQNSALGTADIVNKIQSTLRQNPDECFILQGYSQGAAATVNAMQRITGPNFDAVKGAFLIGNPDHKAGLACNVDINGGTTTRNVNGLSVFLGSIPQNWVSKTLDVCAFGDGVCDTTHGVGINAVHLTYPSSASSQRLGVDFAKKQLGA